MAYDPGMWWERLRAAYCSARRWRPRTYKQAWLSAAALPLASAIIGLSLKLVFHTWPTFDEGGAIGVTGYFLVTGSANTKALRNRRQAQAALAIQSDA